MAIPIASSGPCSVKNSTARPSVSFGVVVGTVIALARSPGPVPTAHTNFVPPPSMLPYRATPAGYSPSSDSGWVVSGSSSDEPSFERWRVGVDAESLLVDRDVVVEPAEGGEVLRVVCASADPGGDVVGFEPVA